MQIKFPLFVVWRRTPTGELKRAVSDVDGRTCLAAFETQMGLFRFCVKEGGFDEGNKADQIGETEFRAYADRYPHVVINRYEPDERVYSQSEIIEFLDPT